MPETCYPNFFRAMREWREELGLSDRQFALRVLEISAAQWSRLRHGNRALTSEFALACVAKRSKIKGAWIADLVAS